jgi:hypothetical protein
MEDLVLAVLGYILIIGIAYAPQCPKVIQAKQAEKTKEKKKVGSKKYVNPNQLEIDFNAHNSPSNLQNKTIRELKKLASQAKIKYYCNMTKSQLIQHLEGI